jgi:hypothetical protein
MNRIIPAKDVGNEIYQDLVEFVKDYFPERTEAEREETVAQFLENFSSSMFH